MTEVEAAVWEGWERVYPMLVADPAEMKRRLARRRGMMLRVPLDMCVSVRAGDTRWGRVARVTVEGDRVGEDVCTRGVGGGEVGVVPWLVPGAVRRARAETGGAWKEEKRELLKVTGEMVRELCAPVWVEGESKPLAARKMGVSAGVLEDFLKSGRGAESMEVRDGRGGLGILPHQKELMRRLWEEAGEGADVDGEVAKRIARGRRRVEVRGKRAFSPCGRLMADRGDPAWAAVRAGMWERVPEDFEQVVERVRRVGGRRTSCELAGGSCELSVASCEGGEGERVGEIPVWGRWMWVCPGCGGRVHRLVMPVRAWSLPEFLGLEKDRPAGEQIVRWGARLGCERCWRVVRDRSWKGSDGWNIVVSHMSGGLLYGEEVRRPEGAAAWKEAARGKRGRKVWATPRMDELVRRLESGESYAEAAAGMGMRVGSVYVLAMKARRRGRIGGVPAVGAAGAGARGRAQARRL